MDCKYGSDSTSSVGDQSDLESIFSLESTSSCQSSQSEIAPTAISELAGLLLNDHQLMDLYPIAISKVGPAKFQRNFARMLKLYARGLNREASSEIQREAAHFVRLFAQQTAVQVCEKVLEVIHREFTEIEPETNQLELDRFNEWLESLSESRIAQNADGDELSVDSDPSDSEMTTVDTLKRVKEFMVSANAFLDLRHDL